MSDTPDDTRGDDSGDDLFPAWELEEFERGKDELNMAEFPLSLAGKTLRQRRGGPENSIATYSDRIRDKRSGEVIERSVTVTSPADLGLPTYYDEEVLFGILQLTHHRRRQGGGGAWPKRVSFTRFELSRLLGLSHGGSAYRRLHESIRRLAGTTYSFTYSWYDKEKRAWDSGLIINFIQGVGWDETPRGLDRRRRGGKGEKGRVTLTWNDDVHRSFEAGYLRDIDFLEYRAMGLPLAKVLYRYLGKHFYRSPRLSFDLQTLAHEKLGLSRNYNAGQLKQALAPAIRRLEERGFIVPMPRVRRYAKVRPGVWEVHFEQARPIRPAVVDAEPPPPGLERDLVDAGVSRTVAAELVADHPADHVAAKLDVLRWLTDKNEPPQSPGGWLAKCVREDWADPPGYEPPETREAKRRTADARRSRRASADAEAGRVEAERDRVLLVREEVARARLAGLSPAELEALTREALGESPTAFQRRRAERFVLATLAARLEAAGEVPPLPAAAGDAPEAQGGPPGRSGGSGVT